MNTHCFDGEGYGQSMNFSINLVLSMCSPEQREKYLKKLRDEDLESYEGYVEWCKTMEKLAAKDPNDDTVYYYYYL